MKNNLYLIALILIMVGIIPGCEKDKEEPLKKPDVFTRQAEEIDTASAKLKATIVNNGGSEITEKGFFWSENNDNIKMNRITTVETSDSFFMAGISDLSDSTSYYFQAFATNKIGTSTGKILSFSTKSKIITSPINDSISLSTMEPMVLTPSSFLCGGKIESPGDLPIISRGICWDTVPNPGIESNKREASEDTDSFSIKLDNIDAATYYIRAYAENKEFIYYGNQIEFSMFYFRDDRDNKLYKYTEIGSQTWMAENLAFLPDVCSSSDDCGYWVMDYEGTDTAMARVTSNYHTYGVMYNFNAAEQACPEGWHLPSGEEWNELESYLKANGYSGTEGNALKAKEGWQEGGNGTNAFRFNALPGGYRSTVSFSFTDEGYASFLWSNDFNVGEGLRNRALYSDNKTLEIYSNHSNDGCYVRCIKDK